MLVLHRYQVEDPQADMLTLIARHLGVTRSYCRRYLRSLGASKERLDAFAAKPERMTEQ